MEITIIGTGNMGRGIATRALRGGHDVTVIGSEKGKAEELAGELEGSVKAGEEPTGDVVVLAVPYSAAVDIVKQYGDALDGKVVVDITNPVDFAKFEPLNVEAGSAAQEIAAAAPGGAQVVKAFNTVFAGTLTGDGELDVFIAGDDDDAKAKLKELVESSGMRAVDAGPLARAHELEAAGYLHMAVQDAVGGNYASALKIVS
jgi:NADPH-dependent F420 reductase